MAASGCALAAGGFPPNVRFRVMNVDTKTYSSPLVQMETVHYPSVWSIIHNKDWNSIQAWVEANPDLVEANKEALADEVAENYEPSPQEIAALEQGGSKVSATVLDAAAASAGGAHEASSDMAFPHQKSKSRFRLLASPLAVLRKKKINLYAAAKVPKAAAAAGAEPQPSPADKLTGRAPRRGKPLMSCA